MVTYISTNNLAKELNISRDELHERLRELKFLNSMNKLTRTGIKHGAEYKKFKGHEYISWKNKDEIIKLLNKKKSFLNRIVDAVIDKPKPKASTKRTSNPKNQNIDPRKNYKNPEHRTDDGHYVRSKSEAIIDNWFYNKGIVHAYEKRLPIEENLLSDFYLPTGRVYIEFWGYENKPEYLKRKKVKQQLYKKYNFNLIELNDKEVQNLDDILPRMLLKFGIKTF